METLAISIDLSTMALSETPTTPPAEYLDQVLDYLNDRREVMGNFLSCKESEPEPLNDCLSLQQFILNFEKQTIRFQFAFSKALGTWNLQNFKFVSLAQA
jgi:hypothetical protein